MKMYLHKDYESAGEGECLLSFDEPEDLENWYTLTTKNEHYKEIIKDLQDLINKFLKDNDHKSANVAKSLAAKLSKEIPVEILQ